MNKFYFILLSIFCVIILQNNYAQEVDIIPYLKMIETGDRENAQEKLEDLKEKYPDDPSVLFLEGVLTQDGQKAVEIYNKVVSDYPESKYADASLYRIFSYYYAIGLYETAESYLSKLENKYPYSPYIKIAQRDIPEENEEPVVENKETPVEVPQKEIKKRNPEEYKFTIQAGAFSNPDNAQSLKNEFESSGFFSEVREKRVGPTNFHVVLVGKFISEEEAKSFLQVINSEFNLDGRVILLNQFNQ